MMLPSDRTSYIVIVLLYVYIKNYAATYVEDRAEALALLLSVRSGINLNNCQ